MYNLPYNLHIVSELCQRVSVSDFPCQRVARTPNATRVLSISSIIAQKWSQFKISSVITNFPLTIPNGIHMSFKLCILCYYSKSNKNYCLC